MTKLTDTQTLILRTASHHPDGLAAPPAGLPPAPRGAVAKALLGAGLVEVLEATDELDVTLAWKLDGEAVFLRITDAGLTAIGITGGTGHEAPAVGRGERATDGGQPVADALGGTHGVLEGSGEDGNAPGTTEPPQDAPVGPGQGGEDLTGTSDRTAAPLASTGRSAPATARRAAALQVLAVWDDETGERAGLPDAIAALRAAMPQPRTTRTPRQPGELRAPRTGTKQETVLALLRRAEGASGPDMIEATGWAPHTVRGFLAGLKKRGFEVLVHERVRQVGPGKEGAKGSYTV